MGVSLILTNLKYSSPV